MAGNTRGRLKEHFEGIHRNFDWIIYHCQASLALIKDKNPKLTEATKQLAESVTEIDKLVMEIYSKI